MPEHSRDSRDLGRAFITILEGVDQTFDLIMLVDNVAVVSQPHFEALVREHQDLRANPLISTVW